MPDASVLPSDAHLKYQDREIMALISWGPNTYTGQEWGFGNVPTTVVTPSRLDPAQWVAAMKAAEIKSAVLVAKHHDGFCLWPSKDNAGYSMSAVPAPSAGRDIVREMSDACRREGLGFGVYLSPWDRHQASYAKPEYVDYFFAQWDDVMSNYGELCEIWLDGANGGTGWYGGANEGKGETRSIPKDYYRLPELLSRLHARHPQAVAFGGGGEWSTAWCGNEKGTSPETWWCPHASADGKLHWMPSEADFPLRGGWFWHQEQKPKSLLQLTTAYFETVGRGAVMNLGIAPDREGRICDDDVRRLAEFGEWVRAFNKTDFAKEAKIQSIRQENRLVMELALPKAARFACVDIREDIAKGQRISSFEVEAHCGGTWKSIGKGTTVGHRRIVRFDEIEGDKVRVTFDGIAPPQVLSVSLRPVPEVAGDDGARAKDTYPKSKWRVIDETCKEMLTAKNAIDGNCDTLWNTHPTGRRPFGPPQSFTVDCGELLEMRGFDYTPRHDGTLNGMVDGYEFHVSADGTDWKLAAAGEFGNLAANPVRQRVMFAVPMFARYFRFTATHALNGNDRIALAEVDLVAQKPGRTAALGGRDAPATAISSAASVSADEIAEKCPVSEKVRGHENIEWSISYAYHLTDEKKDLPRVLLVGDSICNHYQSRVADRLRGRANITFWVSSYCVTRPGYLQLLAFYLDSAKYDVVHFNNGLHSCETPDADYEKAYLAALRLIREKQPGAKLVWATSTPLNTKDAARAEKVVRLNAAARRAADSIDGISEDDLFSLVDPLDRKKYWVDTHHYTAAGCELLASQVVEKISDAWAR